MTAPFPNVHRLKKHLPAGPFHIWTMVDPRLRSVAVAVLPKPFKQLSKSSAQKTTRTSAT